MAEVGKGNDATFSNTQHVRDELVWAINRLECLGHHDGIEAFIVEASKPLVKVLFDNGNPALNTLLDILLVDFQAKPVNLFLLTEELQEQAVPAAQIENS
jgi:hypothetical protein